MHYIGGVFLDKVHDGFSVYHFFFCFSVNMYFDNLSSVKLSYGLFKRKAQHTVKHEALKMCKWQPNPE